MLPLYGTRFVTGRNLLWYVVPYGMEFQVSKGTTPASRTIVMSGTTRGIGKVAAVRLLQAAPDVHLVAVARPGAEAAVDELRRLAGNPKVSYATAELESLDSMRTAIAALRGQLDRGALPPLAGFVGNAGVQFVDATRATVDGIEATFAVNVVANYVLVAELRQHLRPPARIVITTSDTHFGDLRHNLGMVPAPRWDEPKRLATPGSADQAETVAAGRTAYSTSKLGVIYLVHEFARRLPAGVEVFSFNPGLVPGTGLARDAGPLTRFANRAILPALSITPWARRAGVSGADLAAAAIGPPPGASGSYLNGAKLEPSSPQSYDRQREEELWKELELIAARPSRDRANSAPERLVVAVASHRPAPSRRLR
jgi:NAD(P)-dependent dehydrogenase (short-subunit alcohol dehydrogenase family)